MDILEMHRLFRTLGQQMGLQLVRAILPESIDAYLNTAIMEYTRTVIASNVQTVFQDKVTVQNNPISQINSVRTLYGRLVSEISDNRIVVDSTSNRIMFYTSFNLIFEDKTRKARFVEIDKLQDTLNDYCNRASSNYPVITYVGNDSVNDNFEVYSGDKEKPVKAEMNFIKLPKVVKFSEVEEERINCDLPVHTHHQIVELAVNKFFQSVGSTAHNVN